LCRLSGYPATNNSGATRETAATHGKQVILKSVARSAASNTLSVEQGRVPGGHAYYAHGFIYRS